MAVICPPIELVGVLLTVIVFVVAIQRLRCCWLGLSMSANHTRIPINPAALQNASEGVSAKNTIATAAPKNSAIRGRVVTRQQIAIE